MSSRPEPFWDVLARHLDEAEFLAERWRDALDEPDQTLAELAGGIEARLWAQLDGLAIAGADASARLCRPALAEPEVEAPLAMVASLAMLREAPEEARDELLALLDDSPVASSRWRGIVDALALTPGLVLELDGDEGPRAAGLVEALARRRVRIGEGLEALLDSEDPAVLVGAATLARSGDAGQLRRLAKLANHEDPAVVCAAIETALVRELDGAIASARYWAFEAPRCHFRRRALTWIAVLGDEADHRRLLAGLDDPELRAATLWAAGFGGRLEAVDAALAWLDDPMLGPLAGELVRAIAGEAGDDEQLWLDPPTTEGELPPLAEDLHEDLDLAPEQLLALPDPEAVRRWWHRWRPTLADARLIAGEPLTAASLLRACVEQPLRRHHVLGLAVELRSRGAVRLATRDWARAQLDELARVEPTLLDPARSEERS